MTNPNPSLPGEEVLPCPWCSKLPTLVPGGFGMVSVRCSSQTTDECPISGLELIDGEAEAIAAWNRRSPLSVPEAATDANATPWPPRDVVAKLIYAAKHLHGTHNCDHHGYEEVSAALAVAVRWFADTSPSRPSREAKPEPTPGARNWTEDWAHENGEYVCRCIFCRETFIGHKRRNYCKICAKSTPPSPTEPHP